VSGHWLNCKEAIVDISEKEFAMLILESTNGKFVQCDFGVGFVRLKAVPENQWAVDRINEVRNLTA
jgi:hypothetical protein